MEEIDQVMAFIRTLLNNSQLEPSDIGVISPYRLQCEFIRIICERNGFKDITVGTAEKFQGLERKVIIASTVSSRNESLGSFVSDPQVNFFELSTCSVCFPTYCWTCFVSLDRTAVEKNVMPCLAQV